MKKDPVGKTVLIIDDDAISREQVRGLMESAGWICYDLPSAIGATREILANRVALVIIDVMMPAMRGDALAKLLRGNPRLKNLGLVLISGSSANELERLALETKADAVLNKKELNTELVGLVEDIFRSHRPSKI